MEDVEIGETIEAIMRAQETSTFDCRGQAGRCLAVKPCNQVAVDEKVEPPHEQDAPIDFGHIYEGYDFYDDVSGSKLDRNMAVQAGRAEMEFFKRRGVYTKV